MEPPNFNLEFFRYLESALGAALQEFPDDERLKFELAFTLLQNHPSCTSAIQATKLLDSLSSSDIFHPGDVASLRKIASEFSSRNERPSGPRLVQKVNLAVNNECPMVCRGCYHPFIQQQMGLEAAKEIVDKLLAYGAKYFVISGGDPLLWQHTPELLGYLASRGAKTALDTTGVTLDADNIGQFIEHLTLLRLPLDGSTEDRQSLFRKFPQKNLVKRISSLLSMLDEIGWCRVTIHTVVSRLNVDDLHEMARLVHRHTSVREWVLFQWCPRRSTDKMMREMYLDTSEAKEATESLRIAFPGLSIYYADCRSRSRINFFVQSNGQVVLFGEGWGEEFIIGNLFHDATESIMSSPAINFSLLARGTRGGLASF